jgi:hypothetical protein
MTVQHQVSTAEILLQLWDLQTYPPEQSGVAGKLWKDETHVPKNLWKITILNGKINYFYGHFQ